MAPRRLVLPGRYESVKKACDFVTRAATEAGLGEHEQFHCQLAVDEACTNIIEHAYGGEDRGEIELTCEARPGELTIILFDRGVSFDPTSVPDPDPFTTIDEAAIGGQGLYFIRKVMDEVRFTCAAAGNTLVMVKRKE
jgi:anti-sigma regulatory factor (Ser/Thr protein kinase)